MIRRLFIVLVLLSAVVSLLVGQSFVTYKVHAVLSGSMGKSVPKGSIILSQRDSVFAVGEVIVFKHPLNETELVTHRITRVVSRSGLAYYETKGDANPNGDGWTIPKEFIVGRVSVVIPLVGYSVLLLQSAPGFILFALVTLLVLVFPLIREALVAIKEFREAVTSGSMAS